MNPLISPLGVGVQSLANIKQSKWPANTLDNSSSQQPSGKNLFSYRSNRNSNKPFTKAIIEEVTKEHFFTKDSKMYKRDGASEISSV